MVSYLSLNLVKSSLNSLTYGFQIILSLCVNFFLLSQFEKSDFGYFVTTSQFIFLIVQFAKFGVWETALTFDEQIVKNFKSSGNFFFILLFSTSCIIFVLLFLTVLFYNMNKIIPFYFFSANFFYFNCLIIKYDIDFILGEFLEKILLSLFFISILLFFSINGSECPLDLVTVHTASYFIIAIITFLYIIIKKKIQYKFLKYCFDSTFWKYIWNGKRFFILNIENNLLNILPTFFISYKLGYTYVADWNFINSCIKACYSPSEACKALFKRNGLSLYKQSINHFSKHLLSYTLISSLFSIIIVLLFLLTFDVIVFKLNAEYIANKSIIIFGLILSFPLIYINLKSSIAFLLAENTFIYKLIIYRLILLTTLLLLIPLHNFYILIICLISLIYYFKIKVSKYIVL